MAKEEVFELIKEVSNTLIHTDIIIYPAGSMEKNIEHKCNAYPYIDGFGDKDPTFLDIQNYRESLLELINKLIDFYKEM